MSRPGATWLGRWKCRTPRRPADSRRGDGNQGCAVSGWCRFSSKCGRAEMGNSPPAQSGGTNDTRAQTASPMLRPLGAWTGIPISDVGTKRRPYLDRPLVGTLRCGVPGGRAAGRIAGLRPLEARTGIPIFDVGTKRRPCHEQFRDVSLLLRLTLNRQPPTLRRQ